MCNRVTPKFDAVEDIRFYLGDRYDRISTIISPIVDPVMFSMCCSMAGIEGFRVEAWYDLYHGDGSYKLALANREAVSA